MREYDVVIIGAGYTGLTAALDLVKSGKSVCVLDADSQAGGLAASIAFKDGVKVEKFYHHWFNNDNCIPRLAEELGLLNHITRHNSRTGMFLNGQFWNLSSPLDLLRFSPLPFLDRIRLGLMVLRVRKVSDWQDIEHLGIREWLEPLCGKTAYNAVWEPLIRSKFSIYADEINAVWMWKKLVLRGSTRNAKKQEELLYFKGGFEVLTSALCEAITAQDGHINLQTKVNALVTDADEIVSIQTSAGAIRGRQYIFTCAFPQLISIFGNDAPSQWRDVKYLANITLILRLNRKLSDIYWLNVNDPGFPFVAVIEHTNLDSPDNYNGTHIVYLSRYLPTSDPVWQYSDSQYFDYAGKALKNIFPTFDAACVGEYHVSRAEFTQPVTGRHYSKEIPAHKTPFRNAFIANMAQIYPEDRGTNYAVREGHQIAQILA